MPLRVARLAVGLAAAAGVAWVARCAFAVLEARRCRLRPLTPEAWAALRHESDRNTVAALVQRGGVAPSLRAEVWPLLLGLRGETEQADTAAAEREAAYAAMQRRCKELAAADDATPFSEACRVISVDVPRTPLEQQGKARRAPEAKLTRLLRAYAAHDGAVGYCQGMSELAALFMGVFGDEALCFAAFAAFIARQRRSFQADVASGVCARLRNLGALLARADAPVGARLERLGAAECTWALRPMVVLLMRELSSGDAATLFDVLMASADDFILFVIAAALLRERRALLCADGIDDLLHIVNRLAGRVHLGRALADARRLQARMQARKLAHFD